MGNFVVFPTLLKKIKKNWEKLGENSNEKTFVMANIALTLISVRLHSRYSKHPVGPLFDRKNFGYKWTDDSDV